MRRRTYLTSNLGWLSRSAASIGPPARRNQPTTKYFSEFAIKLRFLVLVSDTSVFKLFFALFLIAVYESRVPRTTKAKGVGLRLRATAPSSPLDNTHSYILSRNIIILNPCTEFHQ